MSEINWQKLIGSIPDNDEALLAMASCLLKTSDNFTLMQATGLAPGWISSQIGAWRSSFLLVGDFVARAVALKRFPVLAATFAALDAGELGLDEAAPEISKPTKVAPVVETVSERKELAMSEEKQCTRSPGCTREQGHPGWCPGRKKTKAETVSVETVPVVAAVAAAGAAVAGDSLRLVQQVAAPVVEAVAPKVFKGRIKVEFIPDDPSGHAFAHSWPTELSLAAVRQFLGQFDYEGSE